MINLEFFKIVGLCRFETYELTARDEDRVSMQEKKKRKSES